MRKRTVAAIWLGLIAGIIAMALVGFIGEWADTPWRIPFSFDGSPHILRLQVQAVLLRTCHLMLAHGATFIIVAILICLAFARWFSDMPDDRGERLRLRAILILLCLETLTVGLGCIGGFVASPAGEFHLLTPTNDSLGFLGVTIEVMTLWLPLLSAVASLLIELISRPTAARVAISWQRSTSER